MKKILDIVAALVIWGCILILCGERAEEASMIHFYTWKGVALVVLLASSLWLDSRLSKEETK